MFTLKEPRNTSRILELLERLKGKQTNESCIYEVVWWFRNHCDPLSEPYAFQKSWNAIELLARNGVVIDQHLWKSWIQIQKKCNVMLSFFDLKKIASNMSFFLDDQELRRLARSYIDLAVYHKEESTKYGNLCLDQVYYIMCYARQNQDIRDNIYFEIAVLDASVKLNQPELFWKIWNQIFPKKHMGILACYLGMKMCCIQNKPEKILEIYANYQLKPCTKDNQQLLVKFRPWVLETVGHCKKWYTFILKSKENKKWENTQKKWSGLKGVSLIKAIEDVKW